MLSAVLLLGLLEIAVVRDMRRHRIPNFLVLLSLALKPASQAIQAGSVS